ncbi:metal-dependent hydrolase [Undibacterium sp.]|uniref:metal-dependent hydrolase n=1 Tax=Undibacterium sp. TaxID=1914977 RepID=UPI00374CE174
MATIISHAVIPLSLGLVLNRSKYPWRLIVVGMLCAMLPDLDVLTFKFGIAYDSPFGHRGFTHSLAFAAVVATTFAAFAKYLGADKFSVFGFVFIAAASHGVLDAMTTGGLGVEFFWPFSQQRYFFPEQFIQVSPIGLHNFMTARGLEVIQSELLTIWLPCAVLVCAIKFYFLQRTKP